MQVNSNPCILTAHELHPVMVVCGWLLQALLPHMALMLFPWAIIWCWKRGSWLQVHVAGWEKSGSGWDLNRSLAEVSRTLQCPLVNLSKYLPFQSSGSWNKTKTNCMKVVSCVLMSNETTLLPHFSLNEICCCLQLLSLKVLPKHDGKDRNTLTVINHVCATYLCFFMIIFCVHFCQMTAGLKLQSNWYP